MRNPPCNFCRRYDQSIVDSMFVLVTGDMDSQEVENWFVCMKHADWMCGHRANKRIMLDGVIIDYWRMDVINDNAREYGNSSRMV